MRRSTAVGLIIVLFLAGCASTPQPDGSELTGLVVVEIFSHGTAAEAGIEVGDVLLEWSRLEGADAPRSGVLVSPPDLRQVQLEEAPRGVMVVDAMRGGEPLSFELEEAGWRFATHPRLGAGNDARLAEALQAGGAERAAELRELAVVESRPAVRAWLLVAAAEAAGFDQAEALWQAATEAATDDHVALGWVCEREGDALLAAKRFDEAEERYDRAFRSRPEGSLAAANSLFELGHVAKGRGDFEEAEARYHRVLEVRERMAPGSLTLAVLLNRLGVMASYRRDLEEAEAWYRRALAIQQRLVPGGLEVALSLDNLGVVVAERGDLEAADSHHSRALRIFERVMPGSFEEALSLNNLGRVSSWRGDLEAAQRLYGQAHEILERVAPGSLPTAAIVSNLGTVAGERGYLEEAEQYFRRALEIRQRVDLRGDDVAQTLVNLGVVAKDRGDLEAAERCHRTALETFERLAPGSLDVALSLDHLGEAALGRGDVEGAEVHHRRAREIWERLAPQSLHATVNLNDLGNLARIRGDLDAAERCHREALEIQEHQAPGSLDVAASLRDLAVVATERGDLEAAEARYRHALEVYRRLAPGSAGEAHAHHRLGVLLRTVGRSSEALQELARAIEALETQGARLGGSEQSRASFRAERMEYYGDYLDLLLEFGRDGEAFHVLESSRARGLLEMLVERELVFGADLPELLERERRMANVAFDRAQARLGELSPVNDVDEVEVLIEELRQLRARQDEIRSEIRRRSPHLAALQYPEPLDLEAAQTALDPGTVLLAYSLGKESGHLFVVSLEEGLRVAELAVGEEDLRDDVARLRHLIGSGRETPSEVVTRSLVRQAARLYETLIAPAEAEIAARDRLLVMPYGPLHAMPFAALVSGGEEGRPHHLIERLPVHSVVSMTVYAELRKRRSDSWGEAEVVALGDPVYPGSGEPDPDHSAVRTMLERGLALRPLPATRAEVLGIAALYGDQARTHLGADATEERAKAVGRGVRYLHLAAHGLIDERLPLNSAVALTIREEPEEGQDNGLLQAWEVFESVRIDADIVVLSACDTALGKEVAGEGIVGLTRAFQYAGTPTVLASLWRVADRPTAVLMRRFYAGLKDGLPKDEALRQAQLAFINEPVIIGEGIDAIERDLEHPFYWAAFQLHGDWR